MLFRRDELVCCKSIKGWIARESWEGVCRGVTVFVGTAAPADTVREWCFEGLDFGESLLKC